MLDSLKQIAASAKALTERGASGIVQSAMIVASRRRNTSSVRKASPASYRLGAVGSCPRSTYRPSMPRRYRPQTARGWIRGTSTSL